MSEVAIGKWADAGFIPVYRDGSLSHLRGANPGTPYTLCGLDAGSMERRDHPINHAGVWCSKCFAAASARPLHEGKT